MQNSRRVSPWAIVWVAGFLSWSCAMMTVGLEYVYSLLRRLGVLALVCCVLWGSSVRTAYAQSLTYPDGMRSAAHWYYCTANRANTTGSAPSGGWSATTCLKLLWSPGESYHMVAGAVTESGGNYREIVGWLIPARYVRSVSYRCLATSYGHRISGVGSGGTTITADNSVNFTPGTSDWSNGISIGVGNTAGVTYTNSSDVVAHWDAMAADNWWTHDVVANWTSSGNTDGTGWRIVANSSSNFIRAGGNFECWVVDYAMDDGHSRWVPGEDDVAATPTATPGPTATATGTPIPCTLGDIGDCFQITPFPTWDLIPVSTIPVATVVTTVTLGVGTPEEQACYTVVPGTEHSVTTWFGDWDVGFEAVEVCTRERSLSLVVDEFDIGGWALGLFGVTGAGVLWGIFRR